MSVYAKSVVAAVAAVLIAGVQAWQVTVGGQPFHLIDLLPVLTAAVGAFYTYLVPEVPELLRAKTWIAGGFAVLTALSTFVTGHPADVTVLNLLIAGLSAAVVHVVPNAAVLAALLPAAADAVSGHADLGEITDALKQLEHEDAAAPSPDLTGTAPIPAVPAPAGPLPIEADALAATTATQGMPAVTG